MITRYGLISVIISGRIYSQLRKVAVDNDLKDSVECFEVIQYIRGGFCVVSKHEKSRYNSINSLLYLEMSKLECKISLSNGFCFLSFVSRLF